MMKQLYKPPPHLLGNSADEIQQRMWDAMPDDIDKSELNIPWDFTRPAAMEKARMIEFELNETIKLLFPQWAYGEWLDYHAEQEGTGRRAANKASGAVLIKGKPGAAVATGFQFATPAGLSASILYEAIDDVTLVGEPDEDGLISAAVPIRALEGGLDGNVPPDAVILMVKPNTDIVYVTNPTAITGGTLEESDEMLQERIMEIKRLGTSFTGCDADYVRWAKEVSGVGNVVVEPEWDDPELPEELRWVDGYGVAHCSGAVRLFVVDANGVPANQQILDAVYDHIVNPDNRINRLAPIGAIVTVEAPVALTIDVSASVQLKEGESLEAVKERFIVNLNNYWLVASTENDTQDVQSGIAHNYVKWVYVGSTLAQTAGVADYIDLTVNGGVANVLIPLGEFPVTGEVDLIEY